jgi:hypothetical protein
VRHGTARQVKKSAEPDQLRKIAELVSDPTLPARLKSAQGQPGGLTARRLLRSFMPVLRSAAKRIPWTPMHRQFDLQMMHAAAMRFGPHSYFFTIAPHAAGQPLVIRMGTRRREPGLLPRPGDGVVVWVDTGQRVWAELQRHGRARAAREDPAAAAFVYDKIARALMTHVFGCALVASGMGQSGSRSEFLLGRRDRRRGALGHCRAGHAGTESQSRGALHLHALLWMLHGPQFHARYLECESCRTRLAQTIDAAITAAIGEPWTEATARAAAAAEAAAELCLADAELCAAGALPPGLMPAPAPALALAQAPVAASALAECYLY